MKIGDQLTIGKITVTKRADDYHACITGDPTQWDCGASICQAIGTLVMSHPESFA